MSVRSQESTQSRVSVRSIDLYHFSIGFLELFRQSANLRNLIKIISPTCSSLLLCRCVQVTLCIGQSNWRFPENENVNKLLWAIQLTEKFISRIYHTIIYSWHAATHMWPIMELSSDPRRRDISVNGSKFVCQVMKCGTPVAI